MVASETADRVATFAGLTLGLASAWLLISTIRRSGRAPWPVLAVMVAATAAITLLPGLGATGAERVGTVWWGSDAGVLPMPSSPCSSARRLGLL